MRVSTDPKLLDQRLKLLEHAHFFEAWFGRRWERKVELSCGLYRDQVTKALRGEAQPSAELLFKLRTARTRLLERAAGAT